MEPIPWKNVSKILKGGKKEQCFSAWRVSWNHLKPPASKVAHYHTACHRHRHRCPKGPSRTEQSIGTQNGLAARKPLRPCNSRVKASPTQPVDHWEAVATGSILGRGRLNLVTWEVHFRLKFPTHVWDLWNLLVIIGLVCGKIWRNLWSLQVNLGVKPLKKQLPSILGAKFHVGPQQSPGNKTNDWCFQQSPVVKSSTGPIFPVPSDFEPWIAGHPRQWICVKENKSLFLDAYNILQYRGFRKKIAHPILEYEFFGWWFGDGSIPIDTF